MTRFALTANPYWEVEGWTLNGEPFEPEDDFLIAFELDDPLEPGATVKVGFDHSGHVPNGATLNGGGASEFILPSGVVLTSFRPTFAPIVGFSDGIGVDEENQSDSREYAKGYHHGRTAPIFGSGGRSRVRTKITGPSEYTFHGVGALVSEETNGDTKTVEYLTEYAVGFFNVVGARWDRRDGDDSLRP